MDQYSHEHLTNYLPSLYDDSFHTKSMYDGLDGISAFPYGIDTEPMPIDSSPLSFRSLSPGPSPTMVPASVQPFADMTSLFQEGPFDSHMHTDLSTSYHKLPSDLKLMYPMNDETAFPWSSNLYYSSPSPVSTPAARSPPPPLTVSPQLLHSPTPEHSYASTSIKTEEQDQYLYGSDMDAEGETDVEDDDDDDEYTEPCTTPALRRSSRNTRSATAASSSTVPQTSHSSRPRASSSLQSSAELYDVDGQQLIRTRARRAEGKGKPNYDSVNAKGDFVCETCGHVCKASRKVDFRRHVNTHYPNMVGGATICCGVPVELRNHGPWRGSIPADAPIKTFYGRQMVGGCGRVFSRTDALHRHIELASNSCVGTVKGDWHPSK